jgi:hypothetical protein
VAAAAAAKAEHLHSSEVDPAAAHCYGHLLWTTLLGFTETAAALAYWDSSDTTASAAHVITSINSKPPPAAGSGAWHGRMP